MDKLELLKSRINDDYQSYKQEALAQSKEELFCQSYKHALCGEWFFYLGEVWLEELGDGDGDEYHTEKEREIADALLSLHNIFEELVNHSASLDTFEFGNAESLAIILDEVAEW